MKLRASLLLAVRFLMGGRGRGGRRRDGSRQEGGRRGSRMRGGIIGVGLSLVPLVVVLQVTDGMIAGITSRFVETGSYHIQAVARTDPTREEMDEAAEAFSEVTGVRLVSREIQGLGLAGSETNRTGVTIRALDPGLWERDGALRTYIDFREGRWDLQGDDSILLGTEVADKLGAGVGDTVRIVVARPLSGGRFLPRTASFTVRGVFTSGYQDLDRLWVMIPFDRGFDLLPDDVSRKLIGMKLDDPLALPNPLYRPPPSSGGRDAEQAAMQTLEAVRDLGGTNYRVATWFELERSKFMSFKTTKNLLIFIMVLIVLVAAVNISSTLVMMVLEKQDEIAFLKGVGASPGGIRRLFVFTGFLLGSLGTAAGLGVGLLLALGINQLLYGIEWILNAFARAGAWVAGLFSDVSVPTIELLSGDYYLESIPFALRTGDILLIAGLSILLSTAAAFFPARRAARLRPLEILQKR